jgi:diguanylate cyclase (GGDEF)-like protein
MDLAKSYKDEGLNNDAKEVYVIVGNSLLNKTRINEAIFAFQSALGIDYNYKPAFKGLIEAFTANSEIDKAFAMLNEALGKNAQDPEYLDLLGNIYLKSKMFEQAEATFNYLYQNNKNYYKQLLDVAQGFLDADQLDQVVTTIDRCLEYLLQIKEEGLVTDILTNLLKKDPAHMQTLRRLGYIYMSTQKNNNLISTLKLFVQAALNQGNKAEAVMALQQLLTLEPNEEAKAQLVNLKENEPVSEDDGIAKDPLLQTLNPLTTSVSPEPAPQPEAKKAVKVGSTRTSALLEGMANQSPEILDSQISLLEEMVVTYPDYVEARVKLKNSYLQRGLKDKAAEQFLALGKIYESQGNKELAREMLTEGYKLSMLTGGAQEKPPSVTGQFAAAQTLNRTGAFAKAPATPATSVANPLGIKGRTGSLSGAYPRATGAFGKASVDLSTKILANKLFKKEWRRACRYNRLIALAIAKIDDFSNYLETYGEEMSETCFKRVADALAGELNRPGDELITYPGEGFAIVLPETPADGAAVVAERLKACVEALNISHAKANQYVTLSFGISSSTPGRNANPDDLVEIVATAQLQAAMAGNHIIVL